MFRRGWQSACLSMAWESWICEDEYSYPLSFNHNITNTQPISNFIFNSLHDHLSQYKRSNMHYFVVIFTSKCVYSNPRNWNNNAEQMFRWSHLCSLLSITEAGNGDKFGNKFWNIRIKNSVTKTGSKIFTNPSSESFKWASA